MAHRSLVILGSGYTARFLLPLVSRRYGFVFATSRQPEQKLCHVPTDRRIQFDLERPDSWKNIPQEADLLWCFPAAPLALVKQFAATFASPTRRLVVLGSTSAYDVGDSQEYPPPWIDETASIDLSKPRVQGEEYLRKNCGAILLRVAGIYGPGRNPIDWIKSGRVGPSRKYVNLIHVHDLAAICLAMLERGMPGEAYNVSDGRPRSWDEICRFVQARCTIASPAPNHDRGSGKRIVNEKLRAQLTLEPFQEFEAALLALHR